MDGSNLFNLMQIPEVSENKNYWIIRTNSGDFYDDFILHQYIAISWDYITVSMLNNKKEDDLKRIIEGYEKSSPTPDKDDDDDDDGSSKSKITSIYNKLYRFVFEISKGDIVLIPSRNSDKITIAEVTGDVYEDDNYVSQYLHENPTTELTLCPYFKRRKINTLKTIPKSKLDIYLAKGFNSQHALSNMNEYAPYINRSIYDIYSTKNEIHSTIHAGHPNGISLKELANLINCLNSIVDNISTQCDLDISENDIQVKLNIHSPGLIEMIGFGLAAGISVSIILFTINHLINGGKFELKFTHDENGKINFSASSESKGLRGTQNEAKALELKGQEQLCNIIKELDIKNPELIESTFLKDKSDDNKKE